MTPTFQRPCVLLVAAVSALAVVNALALWGQQVAEQGETLLRALTSLGAAALGVVMASRMNGLARWWRLLSVGALLTWLIGQLMWFASAAQAVPVVAQALYVVIPVLALGSLALLFTSSGGVARRGGGTVRHRLITNVMDGVVAGLSFLVLAILGRFGANTVELISGSEAPAPGVVFAVGELLVVATIVMMVMLYDADRPYRGNFLLLAAGLLTLAGSDRLETYFRTVDVQAGQLWAGVGLIIGPLLMGFAMLEHPQHRPAADYDGSRDLDWAQLILPYFGFVGITILLTYHLWIDRDITPVVSGLVITMIVLIAIRQVWATRAQNQLTQRLFWAQRGLAYQVHHDALTGLPNRLLFAQRLDAAVRDGPFVLIFIDLDDFKEVNDRFGHAAGDELLCAVGERLKRYVNEGDTLARIGGDEYAILIREDSDDPDVVADRLRVALREPFAIHGSSLRVKASMGLVHSDVGGPSQTSDDLLRQADISMYAGKRMGKDSAVVYRPATSRQWDFPTALRTAGGAVPDGFRLVYQPVVDLTDGTLVAVEALARWTAPNGTEIPPETFVAAAEAAGLGARLDELVLGLACSEVTAAGLNVDLHVNVGAARLGSPGFEQDVRRVLTRHRLPPRRLVLEITETLPILDLADAAAQIERFRAVGVKVALDDFGAGYNSLTYLHALPVHMVKLDRSLVVGAEPERDLALYRSVIRLCAELSLDVIAEGIETTVQAGTILAAGCRLAQGHLFGRPTALADVRREWRQPGDAADQGGPLRDPTQLTNETP
ncbi:bifunctional diguanylate cyclase/phosphodiesterase [Mycobacterium sp. SMC-4]|uniref:putative bifunctional diguanylate cyclase/phosphodiesterase n=1 Tax=Mycobacterium sp. SMC-4 TaxID=2857059 RepID=UPI0021B3C9BC|nr:EAL domain-containing protein [Mycobacterium sp. SMC-4]UXA19454.1 EAL domain-containing protein [Mycobacterium sp. SMC-4]